MLNFDINENCYGCGVCRDVCSRNAITMRPNKDGFVVPVVNEELCVQCGLCEKRCIHLSIVENNTDVDIDGSSCYMVYLKNNQILGSASGGTFYGIAEKAMALGYEICGCIWDDDLRAVHIFAESYEDLKKMQGSKYVQSDLKNCFKKIKNKLSLGKKVLFSGTPCQIAGLHRFVGYHQNLLTVGLICEGTPSPMVFERWKEYLEKKYNSKIIGIRLRKKGRYGWNSPSSEYTFENGNKLEQLAFHMDTYMYNFICGLFMRNSCFNCEYKGNNITSDIIIGDCWCADTTDIKKNNNRGISAAIIRTTKGQKMINAVSDSFIIKEISVNKVVSKNEPLLKPIQKNMNRDDFFEYLGDHSLIESIKKYGVLESKKMKIYRVLYHLHLFGIVKKLFSN